MKNLVLVLAAVAAATGTAHAQTEPVHDISFNAAVVSDYRFRGISQSRLRPAVQGGLDYAHAPTGLYVGTWASTIRWIDDAGGSSDVELDLYAGMAGELGAGISYDVGALRYFYPGNNLNPSANTTEVYGQLGYGPAYVKYSHAVTNLFGFADSDGSGYLDVGADFEIGGGYILNLHAGHQRVRNNSGFSYTDWKVGVTKDFGIVEGSLAVIGTGNDNYRSPGGRNLGKNGIVLSVSKTF